MGREVGRQGRIGGGRKNEPALSRVVNSIVNFVGVAEFEIFFVLLFLIAFFFFKNLTARPEYNQILVKKPGGTEFWPF